MPPVLFSLKNLSQLAGGDIERDFNQAMASIVRDCFERPSIEKRREIRLLVLFTPVQKNDGTCDDVNVSIQLAAKHPCQSYEPYVMRATVNGGLRYQPESPENPEQPGLGFHGTTLPVAEVRQ